MKSLWKALVSVYDFFAGDAILLAATAVSFAVTAVLSRVMHESNLIAAFVFVAIVVAGLIATISRELRSAAAKPKKE